MADRYGGLHSSQSDEAVSAYEDAVLAVASHRPEAAAALERAISADPELIAAHALKGLATVILARNELWAAARHCLVVAMELLDGRDGGTQTEAALVAALRFAVKGDLVCAAAVLDDHLDGSPGDLLALKLVHSLRFMSGDGAGMLRTTAGAIDAWTPSRPGYGFVMGLHAFGLEEAGAYGVAEVAGRIAVDHEPSDAWGLHAVAHVFEMRGEPVAGAAWVDRCRLSWTGCNNFRFHLAWHLALFQLELGRFEEALLLYDEEVRHEPTDDFRDVANAASLLVRLEQHGVPVGGRWDELSENARRRTEDTALVFASLHRLLSLLAVGDRESAQATVDALAVAATGGGSSQAGVARRIGLPLARLLVDRRGPGAGARAAALAERLPLLGGSNAQRDVFVRLLVEIASDAADEEATGRLLALRRRLKATDRFERLVAERLLHHLPSPTAPTPRHADALT